MSWRKITFIVVALLILLGGSAALSKLFISMKPEIPKRQQMDMKRYVKAVPVLYKQLTSRVEREGRVVSSSEVNLVSEASGKIEEGTVALRLGSSFKKGDLLATIYKDEMELALKARKSKFLSAVSVLLPDIKVDYPDYLERFVNFLNSIEMDGDLPALPKIEDNSLNVFLASRNFLSEYYGIVQDEKKLSRHSLFAPFNGAFTMVNYEVGSFVNTGGLIAKMIQTDQLEIEVPVENNQSEWIKIGDKVLVSNSMPDSEMSGQVVRKSNFIDPTTQSRSLFVKVEDAIAEDLLVGEYMLVKFPGQLIESAMEIPRSAIFNSNEVFLVENGRLKKASIEIVKTNEKTLIFKGIEEGKKIVIEPLINVKENSPVGIVGEESSEKGKDGRGENKKNKS